MHQYHLTNATAINNIKGKSIRLRMEDITSKIL